MAFKYPETVGAVRLVEHDQWSIPDALKNEIDDNEPDKFEEAQKEIAENTSSNFAVATLRYYRKTAIAFPKETRVADISMEVHATCGNPATLKMVIEAWNLDLDSQGKPRRPLPRVYARTMVAAIREDQYRQLEARQVNRFPQLNTIINTRESKIGTANAAVEILKEKLKDAQSPDDRRDVKNRLKKAERELQKAVRHRSNAYTDTVVKATGVKPDLAAEAAEYVTQPGFIAKLVYMNRLQQQAEQARELAQEALNEIDGISEHILNSNDLDVLSEAAKAAKTDWERIESVINRHKSPAQNGVPNLTPAEERYGHVNRKIGGRK